MPTLPTAEHITFVNEFNELIASMGINQNTNDNLDDIYEFRNKISQYDNANLIKQSIYGSSLDTKGEFHDPFGLGDADPKGNLTRALIPLFLSSHIEIDELENKIMLIASSDSIDEKLDIVDTLHASIVDLALEQVTPNIYNAGNKLKANEIQEVRAQLATIITKTEIFSDISMDLADDGRIDLAKLGKSIESASIISPVSFTDGISLNKGKAGEFDGLIWDENNNLCVVMATADLSGNIEGNSILRHPLSSLAIQQTVFSTPRNENEEIRKNVTSALDIPNTLEALIKHLNQNPHLSAQLIEQSIDNSDALNLHLSDTNFTINDELYAHLNDNLNSFFYGAISKGTPDATPTLITDPEFNINAVDEVAIFYMLAHHIAPESRVFKNSSKLHFNKNGSFSDLTQSLYADSFALSTNIKSKGKQNRSAQHDFMKDPINNLTKCILSGQFDPSKATNNSTYATSHIDAVLNDILKGFQSNIQEFSSNFPNNTIYELATKISQWHELSADTTKLCDTILNPTYNYLNQISANNSLFTDLQKLHPFSNDKELFEYVAGSMDESPDQLQPEIQKLISLISQDACPCIPDVKNEILSTTQSPFDTIINRHSGTTSNTISNIIESLVHDKSMSSEDIIHSMPWRMMKESNAPLFIEVLGQFALDEEWGNKPCPAIDELQILKDEYPQLALKELYKASLPFDADTASEIKQELEQMGVSVGHAHDMEDKITI